MVSMRKEVSSLASYGRGRENDDTITRSIIRSTVHRGRRNGIGDLDLNV